MTHSADEFLICVIARMLDGAGHVAVGAASPIPGAAALLMRELTDGRLLVSMIHGRANNPFTDGGREVFDCAGQWRRPARGRRSPGKRRRPRPRWWI